MVWIFDPAYYFEYTQHLRPIYNRLRKQFMEYHPLVTTIKDLLKKSGMWFETFEHEAVRTSEEAAKIRTGYTLKQGTKAMIVRVKEDDGRKYFVMIVIPGDKRFDNAKAKNILNAKDIRFATVEEVAQLTNGVEPGGVPPFGNLTGLKVFADKSVFENEKIIFNAGDRRFSIAMKSEDYRKLVDPIVVDII